MKSPSILVALVLVSVFATLQALVARRLSLAQPSFPAHRTRTMAQHGGRGHAWIMHSHNNCKTQECHADESVSFPTHTRRGFLSGISYALWGTAVASLVGSVPDAAVASDAEVMAADDPLVQVYFGCGCFWHVQHELVQAERQILGRLDSDLTSRAGYAGGKLGMRDGKVCYHNAMQVSDYGKLGHAEVVSLRIPSSKFYDFAVEYCKLFKNGMRADQFGDRGLEYRNLVGLPGGTKNPLASQLVEASKATGDQLDFAVGKGSDDDIARLVWIMNTDQYPVYVAEQYHQFHDGFNLGENYPDNYNSLGRKFAMAGEDFGSCPNGMVGIGVGGL